MSLYQELLSFQSSSAFTPSCTSDVTDLSYAATFGTLPSRLHEDQGSNYLWKRRILYISDLHLDHHICLAFSQNITPPSDKEIENYVADLVYNLFPEELRPELFSDICRTACSHDIFLGGDIASCFSLAKLFYSCLVKEIRRFYAPLNIYMVLGNHELWGFPSLEICRNAYRQLCTELGIHFLDNSIEEFHPVDKSIGPANNRTYRQFTQTVLIVGGTGFAAYNSKYNAGSGLYKNSLSLDQEKEETEKWLTIYRQAQAIALEKGYLLIVLTHNPLPDWKEDATPDHGCVYFYGHNHQNLRNQDEENDIFIFADNQIGYTKTDIAFKHVDLFTWKSPFAGYPDGLHQISIEQYILFNQYCMVVMQEPKRIKKHLADSNNHLYMIKQDGYFGFFLFTTKSAYICEGSKLHTVPEKTPECVNHIFIKMISSYISLFDPYRKYQESIAQYVKSFGGSGKIHGTFVDIDFFNHIYVNPVTGIICCYYAPDMVSNIPYDGNLSALLETHNPTLFKKYKSIPKETPLALLFSSEYSNVDSFQPVSSKNAYKGSHKMNQIQHLFYKKILRTWDPALLRQTSTPNLPNNIFSPALLETSDF